MMSLEEILGWLGFMGFKKCITQVVFVFKKRVEQAVFVDGSAYTNATAVSMGWCFARMPFSQNVGCVCGDLAG